MIDIITGLVELTGLAIDAIAQGAKIYIILKVAAWAYVNLPPLSTLYN